MRRSHNTATPSEQEDAILKAAIEEIELVGMGRASLEVVARQAGVSRSTLYRRFPNREALLSAVGRRTFETALSRLSTISVGASPQEAAVAAFAEGLRLLTTMPILRQFLQLDAGTVIVEGMYDEAGEFLVVSAAAMAAGLRAAGATMPDAELAAVAELHIRLACSLAQVPTHAVDIDDQDAVRAYATRYLAALVW
ncbi:MAG: helix-turn-helix domain-containing protein [Mycobacterium sp.]